MLEHSVRNRLAAVEKVLSIFVPKHKKPRLDPGISSYTLAIALSSKSTNPSKHLSHLKMLPLPSNCTRLCLLGLALACSLSWKKSRVHPPSTSSYWLMLWKKWEISFDLCQTHQWSPNPLMHWLTAWFSFSVVTHLKFHQYSSASRSVGENQWQQPC